MSHKASSKVAVLAITLVAIAACTIDLSKVDGICVHTSDTCANAVVRMVVTPKPVSLVLGDSVDLVARYYVNNVVDSSVAITWNSLDATKAVVSSYGLLRGRATGQARITASAKGVADTVIANVVSVPLAAVASVAVEPTSVALDTGTTVQLSAVVKDAAGTTLIGRLVTWSINDTTRALVAADGLVRGVRAGDATITATSEGRSAHASITVKLRAVASVTVQPGSATLDTGKTAQLSAVLKDAAGNTLTGRAITWSSNDTTLAKVASDGLVRAVRAGSATITATSEGKSGTASITIKPPVVAPAPVATVVVQPSTATVDVNVSVQLTAVLKDSTGATLTGRTISWTSSTTAVATVTTTGLVRGASGGSSTITATSEGKSGTAVVTVNTPPTATSVADPTLLPIASRQLPTFESYTGRTLAAGGSYVDPATNVRVWKATDASTPVANGVGTHDYGSGAVQASRMWGSNQHTILANISGAHWLVDFTRGSGFSNWRRTPAVTADLSFTFSQSPSTPQIGYYVNGTTLGRYDTKTNTVAPTGFFPKSFASVTASPLTWLHQDRNDGWFVMMPTDKSLVIAWNSITDVTQVIRPGALDEPHLDKDGRYVALLIGATAPDWRIYDLQTQTLGAPISKQTHLESLRSFFVSSNPDIASGPQYYYNATTGIQVSTLSASKLSPDGQHRSGQWVQSDAELLGGSLLKQWYVVSDYEDGVVNAGTWTLQSGQIYSTVPNYAPAYEKPSIGVQSVRQLVTGAPGQVSRQLTKAASVAAMTAGSFYFDAGANLLYVWQVGGGAPSASTVALRAPGAVHDGIGFVRVDGSEVRLLAHTYTIKPAQYWDAPRATLSADGKLVLFSTNMNNSGGRPDLFVVEVPIR